MSKTYVKPYKRKRNGRVENVSGHSRDGIGKGLQDELDKEWIGTPKDKKSKSKLKPIYEDIEVLGLTTEEYMEYKNMTYEQLKEYVDDMKDVELKDGKIEFMDEFEKWRW